MRENLFDREDMKKAWDGFIQGNWSQEIDVRDFIQKNYKPYEGDDSFLESPTENTEKIWGQVSELIQ
ncbi:MAG: hypothetical protein Q4G11_07190, partial [Gallicola sp.]|nr:hypothetical protein [Gallicola sp.]